MTPPEVALWAELRKRPGGFKFRRQHRLGCGSHRANRS
ncbi:endonuclease domain-containing protein [Erythrobacter sp. LQ02-29]|nr:endonuclease domain-containing protein [Erythrobacter sp. LQ02-29]